MRDTGGRVVERGAHFQHPDPDSRLDGPQWHAEMDCQLPMGEPSEKRELNRTPLVWRQRHKRRTNPDALGTRQAGHFGVEIRRHEFAAIVARVRQGRGPHRCSKPIDGTHHSWNDCGMHWETFNKTEGQSLFREKVNTVLSHYARPFVLNAEGEVLRRRPDTTRSCGLAGCSIFTWQQFTSCFGNCGKPSDT